MMTRPPIKLCASLACADFSHLEQDLRALELAKVEGLDFQFVVRKGSYKVGDYVVYFPVDSLLPDDLIKFINMEGKFSGKNHNRVKTIKLRGRISQGFALNVDTVLEFLEQKINDQTEYEKIVKEMQPFENMAELLNVEKFEPEPVISSSYTSRFLHS